MSACVGVGVYVASSSQAATGDLHLIETALSRERSETSVED